MCPVSHGIASVLAQDQACSVTPPDNGRLMRNLVLGANYIQSHILHFYTLAALDFVDIGAIAQYQGNDPQLNDLKRWVTTQLSSTAMFPAAPFLPRYDSPYISSQELNITGIRHYLDALEMRKIAHQMGALFAGKLPHAMSLVPGGITEKVTVAKIEGYLARLKKLQVFIANSYIPDVVEVAKAFPAYFNIGKGYGNFLAYGVFKESSDPSDKFFPSGVLINGKLQPLDHFKITEAVRHSFFSSTSNLHPLEQTTVADADKDGAYSWLKAPRYDGRPLEVGPLARFLVAYHSNKRPEVTSITNKYLSLLGAGPEVLVSTLGRHLVRALEAQIVSNQCEVWLNQLRPDKPSFEDFDIPEAADGVGLTEAPRGALGHFLRISAKKIGNYQCVVPTTWNCSPRDDNGVLGPIEQALLGTPIQNEESPIEATRVVRSFDPCLACAVH